MSDEKIFADGLIVKDPSPKAPDFVLQSLSFKVSEFVEFLKKHEKKGWVNVQMKRGRSGKPYAALDTWEPTQGEHAERGMEQARAAVEPAIADDDIPF